mmetsp:Transcript_11274/g.20303  ORF Transcript_11274/g.20303 Transcript_11274/m.20303 type:complete len:117 (+) Transcript_11274:621-971(+)
MFNLLHSISCTHAYVHARAHTHLFVAGIWFAGFGIIPSGSPRPHPDTCADPGPCPDWPHTLIRFCIQNGKPSVSQIASPQCPVSSSATNKKSLQYVLVTTNPSHELPKMQSAAWFC